MSRPVVTVKPICHREHRDRGVLRKRFENQICHRPWHTDAVRTVPTTARRWYQHGAARQGRCEHGQTGFLDKMLDGGLKSLFFICVYTSPERWYRGPFHLWLKRFFKTLSKSFSLFSLCS